MYIEKVPNRNSKPAILLREGRRVDGKVVKRTIANLSSLPAETIEVLRQSLKGANLCDASKAERTFRPPRRGNPRKARAKPLCGALTTRGTSV